MINIEEFIKILENEIVTMTNVIEKVNIASSLTKVIDLITKDTIWDLTVEDLEYLEKSLEKNDSLSLSSDEKSFLNIFVGMPLAVKNLKRTWGLDVDQEIMIEEINGKIREYQQKKISNVDLENLENLLREYKVLFSKFKQNDINLITEIDLVASIMNKHNVPLDVQMGVYREINTINNKIFDNYNIQLDGLQNYDEEVYDETDVSVDDLVVTNVSEEELRLIFEEYNIKWVINVDENTTEEEKIVKETALQKDRDKLLKYGDINKFRSILDLLVKNDLGSVVFNKPEVLTRTLLYSSVEQLNKFIGTVSDNGLNLKVVVSNAPTVLYPNVRETDIRMKRNGSSDNKTEIRTGSLKYFSNCVDFLNSHNYDVAKAYRKCSSLFLSSIKSIKASYDLLRLYNVDLSDLDERFSILAMAPSTLAKRLDCTIESECFDVYCGALSFIKQNENIYKIKLARSIGATDEDIYSSNDKKNKKIINRNNTLRNNYYGTSEKETFAKYGAVSYKSINEEFYNSILKSNKNISFNYDLLSRDDWISKLDSIFKNPNNELEYVFDGVVISRIKVLIIYQALISSPSVVPDYDVLMYAITKNSMLNADELEKIDRCIKNPLAYKDKLKNKVKGGNLSDT